ARAAIQLDDARLRAPGFEQLLGDGGRSIIGSVVDDDEVIHRARLRRQGLECLAKQFATVVRDQHSGHLHSVLLKLSACPVADIPAQLYPPHPTARASRAPSNAGRLTSW